MDNSWHRLPDLMRTLLAYFGTYVIWGSTFLGIRIAVQEMEPFTMAGIRFLVAGLMVLAVAFMRPSSTQGGRLSWPKAFVSGGFYTLGTHGIVSHIARTTPSGSIAVAMATIPLMTALVAWAIAGQRATVGAIVGIFIGIFGVALLAWPGGTVSVAAALWLLGAALSWALGSVLTVRWSPGLATVPMAGRQMLAGGILLMLAGGVSGEMMRFTWPSPTALGALGYLIVFGTIFGYFSYLHLMARTTVTKASSYQFVNPIVAVTLGALFAGEALTLRLLIATPFILVAVVLVLRSQTVVKQDPECLEAHVPQPA